MTVTLTSLAAAPAADVEALLDAAFGRDRHARTAYRLRQGAMRDERLSVAAWQGTDLVGALLSWPLLLDDAPLTLVGPVAVAPGHQGRGIGGLLMQRLAERAGDAPLAMIGDPDYYARFGFTAAATGDWLVPGPVERHRLLARNAGALARPGVLRPFARAALAA